MNLHLKRAIDYYLGRPLLWGFEVLTRVLGVILRRQHQILPVKNVLIMKFQGMGSLLMAKEAITLLRQKHPQAKIIFWGTPGTVQLARFFPEFDEILTLNDRSLFLALSSLLNNFLRIWTLRPDWVFDLEVYSKLSTLLATLTCGRNRAGFAIDSVASREYCQTHLVLFNRYEYIGEAYKALLGLVGRADQVSSAPLWNFDNQALAQVPRPYIVINPHSGDLALERKWPIESFHRLTEELLKIYPQHHLVLIGHGKTEFDELKKFPRHERILNLANAIDLQQTIQLLSHADLMITNDTGPLHIAAKSAVTNIVALFGPTHPVAYADPQKKNLRALSELLYCSPCVHHWSPTPCGGDNQCMKRISVNRVLKTCLELVPSVVSSSNVLEPKINSNYYPGLVYHRLELK